ncbi:uncharacterized protein LOC109603282 [Aethina tumida]|uniref:uncharacterized protein LOC109603282 n=1 Tax=Aethina tumida TaxID=116153 RepID=UPI0021487A45|nr:uncharacterized protein LOC109603282 [Aethina tumida]
MFCQANNGRFFASPFKWVIYIKNENFEYNLNATFAKVDILVDSDVTLAMFSDNNTATLQKIYKRRRALPIIFENFANWTQEEGIEEVENFERVTARRRRNLGGLILNTCIVITNKDTLNHLTDKRDKHIDSIEKVNYVLVEHLAKMINAKLNYTIRDTWGYKNNESKWSGMIGELTENRADIGGTPLFFTSDRIDIIEYIAMTTPTRSKFVFREPKLSYVTNVYTLPFDNYVWYSTMGLVVIAACVLFVAVKWEWILRSKEHVYEEQVNDELRASVLDVAFLSFGAVCQQGAATLPYSSPGRITTILLFVALFFLYTSYSANIVALLQSSSNSIQNLEDLLKSRLEVGVHDTVFNRFYFPNATEPIRRQIYLQKVAPPGKPNKFMTIEEGIAKMRAGLFAFHVETGAGYKLVGETFQEDEKCGLQEIQFLQVPDPFLAIQKNSSFTELLKIGLKTIYETGLQYREVALIYSKKPLCQSRGSSFISVGIVDCYPPAVVLAAGMIISFLLFLIEIIYGYRHIICKRIKRVQIKQERSRY